MFEYMDNVPAILSKLISNTMRSRKREGGRTDEDSRAEARIFWAHG